MLTLDKCCRIIFGMKIPADTVPINLDESVDFLKNNLETDDLEFIKDENSNATQCHFSLGMSLRNEWSLFEKDSHLVNWFKTTYGIEHAYDISGMILDCLWQDIRGLPRRDKELAERYKKHWESIKHWKNGETKLFEYDKNGDIKEIYE